MKVFTLSCLVSVLSLAAGSLCLWLWGVGPPGWLIRGQVALFSALALAYGFSSLQPSIPRWIWLRPIRGTLFVVCGIAAMYIPIQFLVSAYLMGAGIRLIWASACEAPGSARDAIGQALLGHTALAPGPHRDDRHSRRDLNPHP
ncbi:hypothetical protein [Singulisphaera sp. PoT]|uniref:hypothetical protein n=1 Tax=Singulisphaera sp. PoT TaxID=3411797 RepID=UPI003BF50F64